MKILDLMKAKFRSAEHIPDMDELGLGTVVHPALPPITWDHFPINSRVEVVQRMWGEDSEHATYVVGSVGTVRTIVSCGQPGEKGPLDLYVVVLDTPVIEKLREVYIPFPCLKAV